jgi:hypothetical protein
MYPMLSSLAYKSFKGIGSGGSFSKVYLVFCLWWLTLCLIRGKRFGKVHVGKWRGRHI